MSTRRYTIPLLFLLAAFDGVPVGAQETLERTPNLDGGWTGQSGTLYLNIPARFTRVEGVDGREIVASPAFDVGMGLRGNLLVGTRIAFGSPVVPDHATEWELLARYRPLTQARGQPVDGSATVAWNAAASSLEGELAVARWMGPLRLIGAFSAMSDAYRDGSRTAVAGGAVLHPLAGRLPLALVGDVALVSDRVSGEEVAWSAGAQLGVSFTDHTVSLFATNTASPTMQGRSRGTGTVRFGLEMTVPIPVSRLVGRVVPREIAADAVQGDPAQPAPLVRAEVARYLFDPKRIEIAAGTSIEWTNVDGVVHTVNAEDGAWNSGAIQPGESWTARFDEPGRYLFYCGPHPFMKGEVLVR
jgi:plastocyanin